jgi:hypothetical protein
MKHVSQRFDTHNETDPNLIEEGNNFRNETPQRLGKPGNSLESSPQRRKKDMYSWDEKFVWNFYLVKDLLNIIKFKKWIIPVVHGYINMLSKKVCDYIFS